MFSGVFCYYRWFINSTSQDYQQVLDLMQDIILATDLAHHLRIITDLKKMARGESHAVTVIAVRLLYCCKVERNY